MELVRRIGDMGDNLMKGVRNTLLPLHLYLITPFPFMEFMVRESYNFMPVLHLHKFWAESKCANNASQRRPQLLQNPLERTEASNIFIDYFQKRE